MRLEKFISVRASAVLTSSVIEPRSHYRLVIYWCSLRLLHNVIRTQMEVDVLNVLLERLRINKG